MLLGKRPPCIVFVSIVLFSVRICPRRPEQGNAPSGHAFDLIGIPPLPGSLRGALSGCDGSRRFSCRFNARPVTGRKYHYCFCLLWPSVRMRRTVRLIGRVAYRFRRWQKEGKGCAVLFGFQRTGGGYRESPLTFHAEKLRGLQPSFLIF